MGKGYRECGAWLKALSDGAEEGIFPQGRFRPLVEAALALRNPMRSWNNYLEFLETETTNEGELRLYPFVANKLGMDFRQAGRTDLLAAARQQAMRNTMHQVQGARALSALLDKNSIPHGYSKGFALLVRLYRRPDLRQSADLDIHIEEEFGDQVHDLAKQESWQVKGIPPRAGNYSAIPTTTYSTPSNIEIDIHWRPRREFSWNRKVSRHFHDTLRTVNWRGDHWRVPSDSWLLVETICHGMVSNAVSPIRWVVDAFSLLAAEDADIDWALVRWLAEEGEVRPAFAAGLHILSTLGQGPPNGAWPAASPAQWSKGERAYFALGVRRREKFRGVPREAVHYLLRADGSVPSRIASLPQHLRRRYRRR